MTLHYGLCEMESLYKRHIFQRIDSYYLITVAEDEYFAGNHLWICVLAASQLNDKHSPLLVFWLSNIKTEEINCFIYGAVGPSGRAV